MLYLNQRMPCAQPKVSQLCDHPIRIIHLLWSRMLKSNYSEADLEGSWAGIEGCPPC
jgi:hypothetical protein